MRFKESLALDRLINERRVSLSREGSELEIDKRAQALAVLIEARDKLDAIGEQAEPVYRRYRSKFVGTDEDGRRIKPRRRRDQRRRHNVDDLQRQYYEHPVITVNAPQVSAREIAQTIRREIRRGGGTGN